jgi:hypothetical protein
LRSVSLPRRARGWSTLGRGSRQEAAALALWPDACNPFIEAIPLFAGVIGNARSGHRERAEQDLEALASLQGVVLKANGPYWARQVEVAHTISSGWVAEAQGKTAEAVSLMAAAANFESRGDTQYPIARSDRHHRPRSMG